MLKTTLVLLLGAITLVSVEASAQCVDPATGTEVAEDEHNPSNRCQVCKNATFIDLPERTRCAESGTALQCEEGRVFRDECQLVGGEIACVEQEKGDACPNGYRCDEGSGVCAQQCSDELGCLMPYVCIDERCVEPRDGPDAGTMEPEPTDMGITSLDAGTMADVSPPMFDSGEPDAGNEPDLGQAAASGGIDSGDGGCCAVISGDQKSSAPLLMLLFGALLIRRNRSRS